MQYHIITLRYKEMVFQLSKLSISISQLKYIQTHSMHNYEVLFLSK